MKIQHKQLIIIVILIISFREMSYSAMQIIHYPQFSNLVGLFAFLCSILIWRRFKPIPISFISSSNILMKESAFAFLPICVGSLLMLFSLKDSLFSFLIILTLSTLFPLFVYALMSKKFLKEKC